MGRFAMVLFYKINTNLNLYTQFNLIRMARKGGKNKNKI